MSAPDITSLLSRGSCFQCLPPATRKVLRLALLANWLPLPARLSNTVAWYRPYVTTTVTKDANSRVSLLKDVSGNSRSLTVTTAADGFLLKAGDAGSNSLSYLSARAVVSDPFTTASFTLAQPCTFYLLARLTAQQGITGNLTDGLSNVSAGIILAANSTNVNLNNVAAFNTAIPGGLNTWAVFTAIFNGTSSLLQVNRVASVSGDAGSTAPGGFTLGTRADGNRVPTMDCLEAIVRTGADDAATRDAMQLYLAAKVGLSI